MLILSVLASFNVTAQSVFLPSTALSLDDLNNFRPASQSWQIAGEVLTHPKKDQLLVSHPGKGILVYTPEQKAAENLVSLFEHGDIELELEYMLPGGAASGVYFQGRYEIQLADSWGDQKLVATDAGGISASWDEEKEQSFQGRPARLNVSRAPGLWQKLKIVFEAPRFDKQGKKIKNARFVQVMHNGVLIHENVAVTGPSRGALSEDEKPTGPLMLEGLSTGVAYKNIRYKKFGATPPVLDKIHYSYFEGAFEKAEDFAQLKPTAVNQIEELSWNLGNSKNDFAYRFTGNLIVEKAGAYIITLEAGGRSSMELDNSAVFPDQRVSQRSKILELDAGSHTFALTYYKKDQWIKPALGLFIEGPGFSRHALHAVNSLPDPEPISPVIVEPMKEPRVLRGFIQHSGRKKTHIVSVGEPGNINYTVDLQQGALIKIWKGDFVDVTPMWHSRGHTQLMIPLGSVVELSGAPVVASLKDKNTPWPDSLNTSQIRIKGYELNEARRPTFRYIVENVSVEDYIAPEDDSKSLARTILLSNLRENSNLWVRVAEGQQITRLDNGAYNINKGEYYIRLEEAKKSKPIIRERENGQELIVPVRADKGSGRVKYSLIW
ncbi:hypothetical protein D770_23960 [Flammeovirgaceae bacterium 311]|nr:hypothetical protein D770_23960 [Flammeovirgaceae bacterium 311]